MDLGVLSKDFLTAEAIWDFSENFQLRQLWISAHFPYAPPTHPQKTIKQGEKEK